VSRHRYQGDPLWGIKEEVFWQKDRRYEFEKDSPEKARPDEEKEVCFVYIVHRTQLINNGEDAMLSRLRKNGTVNGSQILLFCP